MRKEIINVAFIYMVPFSMILTVVWIISDILSHPGSRPEKISRIDIYCEQEDTITIHKRDLIWKNDSFTIYTHKK